MSEQIVYTESAWNGFKRLDFTFEGRVAVLICPHTPTKNRNWFFKTEYFSAFPTIETELLNKGYHFAFIENKNRWGTHDDLDTKFRFRDFLVKEFSLAPRCITIGMSCGGLFGIKLAGKYPEMTSVAYLDAPVVNILSLIGMGRDDKEYNPCEPEIYESLSTSRSGIISYRDHPLDYLPDLVKSRIPVCLVYGNCDGVVPYKENASIIENFYKDTGIPFLSLVKDGYGHHPHGLEGLDEKQSEALISFLLENDK